MFTSTCILMLNNRMPPRVAGNRLSSCLVIAVLHDVNKHVQHAVSQIKID